MRSVEENEGSVHLVCRKCGYDGGWASGLSGAEQHIQPCPRCDVLEISNRE